MVLHVQGLSNNRYNVAESFVSQFPGSVIKVSLKMKVSVSFQFLPPWVPGSMAASFFRLFARLVMVTG